MVTMNAIHASLDSSKSNVKAYKESAYYLDQYAGALSDYHLPRFKKHYNWYDEANDTWNDLMYELKKWNDQTGSSIHAFANDIYFTANHITKDNLNIAVSQAEKLRHDPSDQDAKEAFEFYVSRVQANFSSFHSKSATMIDQVGSKQPEFDQIRETMQNIADKAMNSVEDDKDKITNLNNRITDLESEIETAIMTIAGGSVALVSGVVFGGLAFILAVPTGGASLALLIPAAVITTGGIVVISLAAEKIVNNKKKIDDVKSEIEDYEKDISVLKRIDSKLTNFVKQVDHVKKDLDIVTAPWQKLDKYFSKTLEELTDIESSKKRNWDKVHSELEELQNRWDDHFTLVKDLRFVSEQSDAKLEVGDTEEVVKEKIENNTKTDIGTAIQSNIIYNRHLVHSV